MTWGGGLSEGSSSRLKGLTKTQLCFIIKKNQIIIKKKCFCYQIKYEIKTSHAVLLLFGRQKLVKYTSRSFSVS